METGLPFWFDKVDAQSYPALNEDLEVDVAIVGGGIVGLHCAYRLKGSGLRTVVLEGRRIGRQATGRSTAKVTTQHGRKYAKLIRSFGREGALSYADANEGAVLEIAELAGGMEDGAGLQQRDAYIYAENDTEAQQLEEEAKAARSLGLPADLVHEAGLPFPVTALLKYRGQYQFDPYRYLLGLAGLVGLETPIYEQSRVSGFEEGSRHRLEVNGRVVAAQHTIFATQMPIINEGFFFAKAFPFEHPVVAAPLPADKRLDGMFIRLGSPTHSLRTAEKDGQTYLIAAGGEYKGGDTKQQHNMLADLRSFLRQHFDIEEISHCWTNEDFRPMDGAAFVGPSERDSKLLVATGFDAWGLSQGVVAADILADRILGRSNRAAALFDSTRLKPISGAFEFTKGNLEAAGNLFGERLLHRGCVPLEQIGPGEGGVVSHKGDLLAVRRQEDGSLNAFSAVCTHMGCAVGWNAIDRTWDCPCHGSRFDEEGDVMAGPAISPLTHRPAPDEDDEGA